MQVIPPFTIISDVNSDEVLDIPEMEALFEYEVCRIVASSLGLQS